MHDNSSTESSATRDSRWLQQTTKNNEVAIELCHDAVKWEIPDRILLLLCVDLENSLPL